MNRTQYKNNIYKRGEYIKHFSDRLEIAKGKKIEPTRSQVQYRDALYKFCVEKQVVRDGFHLGRTNRAISANIQALITILKKHNLTDEFFQKQNQPVKENDNG